MKIEISDAWSDDDNQLVSFTCGCGVGRAHWEGPLPTAGELLFVEFDSDEVLRISKNAFKSTSDSPSLEDADAGVTLTAELESVYDEGNGQFRFADGRIEMELVGDDKEWIVGAWYKLVLRDLKMADANL